MREAEGEEDGAEDGEARSGGGDAPVKTSHTPTRPPPTVASRVPSGLHAQFVTGPGRVNCRSSAQASTPFAMTGLGGPVLRCSGGCSASVRRRRQRRE